jgi:EpsI family protein
MTSRRELLIGAGCVVAAVGADRFRPHRNVRLLNGATMAQIVPASFGDWRSEDVGDPLAIHGPGTLSAKLYNELVTRVYRNSTNTREILMLLAYGGQQTDELQLHRPEVCYPAFGYTLIQNQPLDLHISPKATLPTRQILAMKDERNESVIYWTRMGEYLPVSGGEQREDRFRIATQGIIPDGLLARFSAVGADPAHAWRELEEFLPALLAAVAPDKRKVLIGTDRAIALSKA